MTKTDVINAKFINEREARVSIVAGHRPILNNKYRILGILPGYAAILKKIK